MFALGLVSNSSPQIPPVISNTKLLLHFDGVDGATSTLDSSRSNHPVTIIGGTISNTQSQFGGTSLHNGNQVTVPASSDWVLGIEEFTLEGWFYLSSYTAYASMFSMRTPLSFDLLINDNTASPPLFNFWYQGGSQVAINGPAVTPNLNQWHHLAVVRVVSSPQQFITVYLDGVGGTIYNAQLDPIEPGTNDLVIGDLGIGYTGYAIDGYLDELRFTKGQAIYTSDFTPPTAPFTT